MTTFTTEDREMAEKELRHPSSEIQIHTRDKDAHPSKNTSFDQRFNEIPPNNHPQTSKDCQ